MSLSLLLFTPNFIPLLFILQDLVQAPPPPGSLLDPRQLFQEVLVGVSSSLYVVLCFVIVVSSLSLGL